MCDEVNLLRWPHEDIIQRLNASSEVAQPVRVRVGWSLDEYVRDQSSSIGKKYSIDQDKRNDCLQTIITAPLSWFRGAELRRQDSDDIVMRFIMGFEKQTTFKKASRILKPCIIFSIRASRELAECMSDTRFIVLGGKSWSFGTLPKLPRRRADMMEAYLNVERDDDDMLWLKTHDIRPHIPLKMQTSIESHTSSDETEDDLAAPSAEFSSSSSSNGVKEYKAPSRKSNTLNKGEPDGEAEEERLIETAPALASPQPSTFGVSRPPRRKRKKADNGSRASALPAEYVGWKYLDSQRQEGGGNIRVATLPE
uniref:Uncharacterized protein n=1 Tax=Timema genevievae TaxID=629358 RepID=A0A7R9JYH7_TIMGE|nr:unnamed protein product [Timema genevievae]